MILNIRLFAAFFIAVTAISTGARAEKVYQCGSTYSQLPCAGAKVLDLDDSRSPAQQQQADDASRRNAQLLKRMEHERLVQEKIALKMEAKSLAAVAKVPGHADKKIKPKRIKPRAPAGDGTSATGLADPRPVAD